MFGRRGSHARRGVIGAIAIAAAVSVSALAAGTTGAAVRSQGKIDKNAVLRFGSQINEQGGVYFDPAAGIPNPNMRAVFDLLYEPMIHRTPDGKGKPGLATKATVVDPNTVEVTLRPGVKFSDGAPFNAAAVKAAWDRIVALNPPFLHDDIKAFSSIEAPNDTTVRIKLNKPIAQKIVDDGYNTLRSPYWLGVPSPASLASGTLNSKPVGAGPYMVQSHDPGGPIVMTKNPNYYDPKAQKFAGVTIVPLPTGPSQITALQSGAVDMIWNYSLDANQQILAQKGLGITSRPGTRVFSLSFCTSDGIFTNKAARQAVQYALDRKSMNEAAFAGVATPTILPLSSASPFYNKKLEKTYSYNPKKAKELLKAAGVAPGTTIRGLSTATPPSSTISEIVQSKLKDIGLNEELTVSTNLPSDATRLRPDIVVAAMDPTLWPFAVDRTTTLNVCGWRNPEASAALAIIQDPSKPETEQQAAYDNFQKILLEESPFVFLAVDPNVTAHTDKVKGVQLFNQPYGPQLLDTVYKTK